MHFTGALMKYFNYLRLIQHIKLYRSVHLRCDCGQNCRSTQWGLYKDSNLPTTCAGVQQLKHIYYCWICDQKCNRNEKWKPLCIYCASVPYCVVAIIIRYVYRRHMIYCYFCIQSHKKRPILLPHFVFSLKIKSSKYE